MRQRKWRGAPDCKGLEYYGSGAAGTDKTVNRCGRCSWTFEWKMHISYPGSPVAESADFGYQGKCFIIGDTVMTPPVGQQALVRSSLGHSPRTTMSLPRDC